MENRNTVTIDLDKFLLLKKIEKDWNEFERDFTTIYLSRDYYYFTKGVFKTKDEAIIEIDKKWSDSFNKLSEELEKVKKQSIWSFIKNKVFGRY